jgi:hypothetical protein
MLLAPFPISSVRAAVVPLLAAFPFPQTAFPVTFVSCFLNEALELAIAFVFASLELADVLSFVREGHNAFGGFYAGVGQSVDERSFVRIAVEVVELTIALLNIFLPLTDVLHAAVLVKVRARAVALAFFPVSLILGTVIPGQFTFTIVQIVLPTPFIAVLISPGKDTFAHHSVLLPHPFVLVPIRPTHFPLPMTHLPILQIFQRTFVLAVRVIFVLHNISI